jgi:hypothetical protein
VLLRSVIKHVRDQNWTAVGIDFTIVVLGVFMGIQIQGIYQDRRDQAQVEDYLQRLHEDFSLSIKGTQRTKKFVTQNLNDLSVVISSLSNCAVANEQKDQFANGLFHLGKIVPEHFLDGTLVELRSSGRLLLFKNVELRDAINEVLREHNYLARVWPALQRRARLNADYIDSKVIYAIDRPIDGFSSITWSEIDVQLEKACKDREFNARLSALKRSANVNVDWLNRNLVNFERVKLLLKQELADK